MVLLIAIIYNIGMLFAFKYFNLFNNVTRDLLAGIGIPFSPIILQIILPIGISFYTFQSLGYVIDVYRGRKAERHLGILATFVAFFPTVLAGPIERADNLIPQLKKRIVIKKENLRIGIGLFVWGLFLKVVIADRLAIVVNTIYGSPLEYTGIPLLLATFFFTFQIYIDFAAYSLMAIGSAKMLGIKIMDNFRRPYLSKSITEFWHRWHISLSTWFRDYLYIPLGGSRVSVPRWYFNLLIVFVVSGLWHGAGITFAIWGFIHGIIIVFEKIPKGRMQKLWRIPNYFKIIITFVVVSFAWIFFRANNFGEAVYIIGNLFVGIGKDLSFVNLGGIGGIFGVLLALVLILGLLIVEILREKKLIEFEKFSWKTKFLLFLIAIEAILFLGVNSGTQFIYFSF